MTFLTFIVRQPEKWCRLWKTSPFMTSWHKYQVQSDITQRSNMTNKSSSENRSYTRSALFPKPCKTPQREGPPKKKRHEVNYQGKISVTKTTKNQLHWNMQVLEKCRSSSNIEFLLGEIIPPKNSHPSGHVCRGCRPRVLAAPCPGVLPRPLGIFFSEKS